MYAAYGRRRACRGPMRDTGVVSDDAEWYWDLERKVAVPASERGPAEHFLGPYPSRFDAENWKAKVEERNEGWDEADDAWKQDDRPS
jgi:hypothetical protein